MKVLSAIFFSSFGFFPVFRFIIGAPLRSGWRCDRQVRAEEKKKKKKKKKLKKKKLKPARIKRRGDFFSLHLLCGF